MRAALIEQHEKPRLVGHISLDASATVAREKPARKKKPRESKATRRHGRPRAGEQRPPKEPARPDQQPAGMSLEAMLADLPTVCDIGNKKNSKGFKGTWVGHNLHVDFADGVIPISCVLTSASVHEN